MKPITDWVSHIALFFTEEGQYIGSKKIKYKERTFSYGYRTFVFDPTRAGSFKIDKWMGKKKYYVYNINDPLPNSLSHYTKKKDSFNPEIFYQIMNTDLIKKLNESHKTGLLALLTPRNLIIFGVIIATIWYFSTGGELGLT